MGAKMIPIVPRLVMWAAGVVAGLAIARLAKREYGRVNEELDEARLAPVSERSQHPTLRRDPRTGVYRL
ncbi:hypothetical protein [Pseudorhodoplanes sp.]|uniref:hypothetical protein n=1 Tax=Pseudorhodoplanes sp. TaxID=1934341 RepID=UPI002CBC91CC|nr:hypothetical protein [Pseudorhodoplanes sp.]HWV52219.1 hypothetical protein [Pseudorhodoplanes sp.]